MNKDKKKIISMIIWCALAIILLVTALIISLFNKTADIPSIDNILLFFKNKWPTILRSITYIVVAIAGIKLIDLIFHVISKKTATVATTLLLINSFIKYAILIIVIFIVLHSWGIDTQTLLASAGILALIIGLGAQSLIQDIISGLFIVFEKEYEVGDIVVIDNFRGNIKEVGIRTTQIIDVNGNIKTINNSEIRNVINLSNDLSIAICDVDIQYDESIEKVETIISQNLEAIKKKIPLIIEGPYYKGVSNLGSSGVTIRLIAKCEEADRYQAERDMNREIKLIFDKYNINIPVTQIVVNPPVEASKTTKNYQEQANRFIQEQHEQSKGLEESQNIDK